MPGSPRTSVSAGHTTSVSKADEYPAFIGGSLAQFQPHDNTPSVGTSFPLGVQLSSLLDNDKFIGDLAMLVAHRGVVFFKNQDLNLAQQRELGLRLGKLSWSGHPEDSTLHKHPISESTGELGAKSAEVSVISSAGGIARVQDRASVRASKGWHTDIPFEPVPSDYSILKMLTLPKTGGDTLWASGYDAYDKLSKPMQKFLEGLTAVHNADFFVEHAKEKGIKMQRQRGSPENDSDDLTAIHPVIRTNPLTGFKSLFVSKSFTRRIVELTPDESDTLLDYLFRQISENHDLQVRYTWSPNDVAIWDNRSALHTATHDYISPRTGNRIVSIGERPFFDPNSKSRKDVIEQIY